MTFKIGTRVKLVFSIGGNIPVGSEGEVAEILDGEDYLIGHADYIVEWDGYGGFITDHSQIIPVTRYHEPCESDFKESLDKLLSEVRETECEPARRGE